MMDAQGQHIIMHGRRIPIHAPVRTWAETGLAFPSRAKRKETRAIVNHWTAAENGPTHVFRNMLMAVDAESRPAPKSVHFVIDKDGLIFQFADTATRCAHAKSMDGNHFSVGIELVNRGDNMGVSPQGVARSMRAEMIHGVLCQYAAFTLEQAVSAIELNRVLCREYELPMQVPLLQGDVYPTQLPPDYLKQFRGVLGHLHLEKKKRDPGLDLLRAIHKVGQGVVG